MSELSPRPLVRSSGETGDALVLSMSHPFPVSHTVCCVSNLMVMVGRSVGLSAQSGNLLGLLG